MANIDHDYTGKIQLINDLINKNLKATQTVLFSPETTYQQQQTTIQATSYQQQSAIETNSYLQQQKTIETASFLQQPQTFDPTSYQQQQIAITTTQTNTAKRTDLELQAQQFQRDLNELLTKMKSSSQEDFKISSIQAQQSPIKILPKMDFQMMTSPSREEHQTVLNIKKVLSEKIAELDYVKSENLKLTEQIIIITQTIEHLKQYQTECQRLQSKQDELVLGIQNLQNVLQAASLEKQKILEHSISLQSKVEQLEKENKKLATELISESSELNLEKEERNRLQLFINQEKNDHQQKVQMLNQTYEQEKQKQKISMNSKLFCTIHAHLKKKKVILNCNLSKIKMILNCNNSKIKLQGFNRLCSKRTKITNVSIEDELIVYRIFSRSRIVESKQNRKPKTY